MIKVSVRSIRCTGFMKNLVTQEILEQAAQYLLRLQTARLDKGLGSEGEPLPPYSPGYAAFRSAHGRVVDRRTLTYTGQMLAGRRVEAVNASRVKLGWSPGTLEAKKAAGNEKRSPFVKATPKEVKLVTEFIQRKIRERAKKILAEERAKKR